MCIMLDSRMGSHLQRFARTAAHLAEREGHLFRHQWCATCGAARIIHGEVMESISPSWYDIFHYFHGRCFPKQLVKLDSRDFPRCSMVLEYVSTFGSPLGFFPQNMVKIWRASRETIWLHIFCGWKDRKLSKDTYFLLSSGHVYQVNVGSSMMRCSRSGLHLPSKKWQRKPRCSSLQWCYPLPFKKGKLRKDWDANPLTGHNPCTSRRIVTMKPYETIRLYDHSC